MASPLSSAAAKKTVDLAARDARAPGSRIRRDPPPAKLEAISIEERDDRDRRLAVTGVILFALAIVTILLGLASYQGWSPSEVVYRM